MSLTKTLVLSTVLIVLGFSGAVSAWDEDEFGNRSGQSKLMESLGQLSFGPGVRLGGNGQLDKTSSVNVNWFLFPGKTLGLRVGGRYNAHTGYNNYRISTTGLDMDLHLQMKNRCLSPFVEAGMSFYSYSGDYYAVKRSKMLAGVNFGAGLSLSLGQHGVLDLTFRQVLNHVGVVYATDSPVDGLLPPDDQSFEYMFYCGFGGGPENMLYNPATFELTYRFSIF